MGSGRGDRNQLTEKRFAEVVELLLQWGPVVVTGISRAGAIPGEALAGASMGSGRGDRNQVDSGMPETTQLRSFNGVRSW